MTFLTDLDEVLRSRGVKVKTYPGWKTRGYAGMSFAAVRGTLWHHTATARSAFEGNDAPTLNLCMYGRSDLPGPLCQIVLGRDGTAHVIAAGWGNHAGYGSYPGIPKDQGNAYLIGIEMESSGVPPYDWTLAQLQAIPVLRDALRDGYGHKLDIAHYEWSDGGKIDPAGLPGGMNWLRAAKANSKITAAASASKPIQEDTLSAAEVKEIKDYIDKKFADAPRNVWAYDQGGKTAQAWHFQKNVGSVVWAHKLKNRIGKTYSAAANLTNNNVNIWDILGYVKSIATALVKKSDIDAAVAEVNAHTSEAMVDAAIEVEVTVKGQEKV